MRLHDTNNQNDKPKCLIYARVSTSDQMDNLSIETQQIKALEKIQELGGYLAEDCYVDSGISGTTLNRPSFQALLSRCTIGDIQYLVVQDISRLSRDTYEYCFIVSQLEKWGVKIVPLTGIINGDPVSRTMNEMMAVMNAFFPRMTSFKVKQTAAEKFKAGYYPSWAPIGYLNIVNPNPKGSYDKKIVVIDPIVGPFVTQAFKLYATRECNSIYDVRQYLTKHGIIGRKGRPLQYSIVGNMLKNPFYWGWMRHGGHEGMGKHEPLIDKETFDLVQQILKERGDYSIRKRKHNFLLRGIVFCKDCGRRYVYEWHYHSKYKAGNGRIGEAHCSQTGKRGKCPSQYINLIDLENQVQQEVSKLEFKPEFIAAVERSVRTVYEDNVKRDKAVKKSIENRSDAVEMKRTNLEEDRMNRTISGEVYTRLNTKLDAQLLAIQKELAEQDKLRSFDISIINEVLSLTQNIAKTYNSVDIDHKRAYLHFFFQKLWVQNKKIVEVEYTPALQVMNEAKLGILSANWLPRQDSNLQPAD